MKIVIEDVNGERKKVIKVFFTERKPTPLFYEVYHNNMDELIEDICYELSKCKEVKE
ncbi:hypothetical protein ES705_28992 [subsurface metagenome]